MSQTLSALYLSWPFTSHSQIHEIEQYHAVLIKEIESYGARHGSNVPLESIYWGGGNLSTYPERLLLDTSDTLRSRFAFDTLTEVTFEVLPSIEKKQLELWGRLGVNRLVFGIKNLKDFGCVPFDALRLTGFDNVAIDLTLGRPGVLKNEWETLVHTVATRPITHLSVYFDQQTQQDDDVADAYCWTVRTLAQYGFEQYELYSFARPGYCARQQQIYFDQKPYKGFGTGACSLDDEVLTPEQKRLEKIMLELRQVRGIARSYVCADQTVIAQLEQQGLIKQSGKRIALTPRGFLVSDEIIMKLF